MGALRANDRVEHMEVVRKKLGGSNDVSEVYSPTRIATVAAAARLREDICLGFTASPPDGSVTFFSKQHCRKRALELLLVEARAELRPLQAKELVASAAQAQLWKLEGVEECLEQCQNPRLIAHKDTERAHKARQKQYSANMH